MIPTESQTPVRQPTPPSFEALPVHPGLGMRHAWDVLDRDLGTVGLLTSEEVVKAARGVVSGEVFPLNLPVDVPGPPLFGRAAMRHEIFAVDRNSVDERLDAFYPQASSQWDGLRHVRAREFGFFGGVDQEFAPGAGRLGIEHWAERGIVGRGVLLDLAAARADAGRAWDPHAGQTISAQDLEDVAARQGVTFAPGDILCVRTGWVAAYRLLDEDGRAALASRPGSSGLLANEGMARWLWDHHFAAVCLDNPAVEAIPGDPAVGSLHRRLIPMLGFALAELLDLDALAAACASDGRFSFLFVGVPMNLPGGVGSPANAVAVR